MQVDEDEEVIIRRAQKNELEDVARFIFEFNKFPESQCLNCDSSMPGIFRDLTSTSEKPEDNIWVAIFRNKIIGSIGYKLSSKSDSIWLIGPFIYNEFWEVLSEPLLTKLIRKLPKDIQHIQFFSHIVNNKAYELYFNNGFKHSVIKHIYYLKQPAINALNFEKMEELTPNIFDKFVMLHQQTFPNSSNSGNDIMAKLNNENKVFIIKDDNNLAGYINVSINNVLPHGFINYVAVDQKFRGKGLGKSLVSKAVQWAFQEKNITQMNLSVQHDEYGARKIYEKVGFDILVTGISGTKDL